MSWRAGSGLGQRAQGCARGREQGLGRQGRAHGLAHPRVRREPAELADALELGAHGAVVALEVGLDLEREEVAQGMVGRVYMAPLTMCEYTARSGTSRTPKMSA